MQRLRSSVGTLEREENSNICRCSAKFSPHRILPSRASKTSPFFVFVPTGTTAFVPSPTYPPKPVKVLIPPIPIDRPPLPLDELSAVDGAVALGPFPEDERDGAEMDAREVGKGKLETSTIDKRWDDVGCIWRMTED